MLGVTNFMKIADSYSVIVIPKDRAGVQRLVVSKERLFAMAGVVFGFILFTAVVCAGLLHYRREHVATAELRNKGRQYQKERVRVLSRLNELEEIVGQNEQFAAKLETLVGLNQGKQIQMGVGGYERDGHRKSPFQLASVDLSAPFDASTIFDETALKAFNLKTIDLTEEAKDMGRRFMGAYKANPDASYFWTSVPTVWPLRGWVTSDFGWRRSPISGGRQLHEGMDIASPHGTPVVASGDGVVTFAGRHGGLGNKVVVDHGYGVATVYGHNSQILVKDGDSVKRGMVIARVGSTGRSTGPHLHYEVLVNGIPVDPTLFILEQL